MSNILETVNDSLEVLESGLASKEEVVNALSFVGRLKEITKELSARVDAGALAWVQANGPIENGDKRWYVGKDKTTKCRDVAGTVKAVLEATGGDVEAFTACLSTGAFKPAATIKVLGKAGDDLFETIERPDLKLKTIDRKLTGKDDDNG